MKKIVLGIIFSNLFIYPAKAETPLVRVDEVVSHLVGIMDTSAQAEANSERVNVQMTTCSLLAPAERTEHNSVYLYQEQALRDRLDRPYRQRILQILPTDDNGVESRSFKISNPETWAGACDRPEASRLLALDSLEASHCSVFLQPIETIYIGQTQPGGCPTNFQGAVKITNTVVLHPLGMDTWDRGFDAQGDLVWGAKDEGYEYRWVEEEFANK